MKIENVKKTNVILNEVKNPSLNNFECEGKDLGRDAINRVYGAEIGAAINRFSTMQRPFSVIALLPILKGLKVNRIKRPLWMRDSVGVE